MANEKVKPTERELGLAGTIENLVDTFEVAVASRDALADTLESLVKIIRKSNDGSRSLIESANEEIAAKYPELFSVEDGELVVAEPEDSEDSEDSEPPLIFGQWVKVKKPAKNESKNINWHHCMDRFDGKIMQVSSVYSMVGSQSDTLQWYVKLEGADGDRSLGEPCVRWSFDPAWLTPLPDLPEGWRYLQPEELVAEGDEFCGLDWVNKRGSWSISANIGRKQADTAVYRRRIVAEAPAKVAEAPKSTWAPKEGDWVTITRPADGGYPGWVDNMDNYDGKAFQFDGKLHSDGGEDKWVSGPLGFYFKLSWLTPWEPKVGDWVRITKPANGYFLGWAPFMDEHDGKVFQIRGMIRGNGENRWVDGPEGFGFRLAWLSPAEAPEPETPKQEQDKEIQPGTKVKILHPDCLGRTGTTSWENCPIPNCLFVWVDSEDPVLRVGAIPVHKRYLAPLS